MVKAPAALPPVKSLWYQLNRWADESKRRSGRLEEEKNILQMPGTQRHAICARCENKVFNQIRGHKGTAMKDGATLTLQK
jgi:hypothetical protein